MKTIVFLVAIVFVKSDFDVSHLVPHFSVVRQGNHTDSKVWITYVWRLIQKLVCGTLLEATSMIEAMALIFRIHTPEHWVVKKKIHLKILKRANKTPDWLPMTNPLYNIELLQTGIFAAGRFNWMALVFQMSTDLATEISVKSLNVYSLHHDRCKHNMTIRSQHQTSPSHTFCGIFSNFTCFSGGHKFNITLFVHAMMSFVCSLQFNLHSSPTKSTHLYFLTNETLSTLHHMSTLIVRKLSNKDELFVHHTVFEKVYGIKISSKAQMKRKSFIYEGPTEKSNNIELHSYQSVFSKSFQVVLITESFHDMNVSFTQWPQKMRTTRLVPANKTKEYFSSPCSSKINLCLTRVVFQSLENDFVQISFSEFSYKGDNGTDCIYGGIAFYDIFYHHNKTQHFHISNLCSSISLDWTNLQPVYSNSSAILVIFYTYTTNSFLHFRLQVQTTKCKAIRLNPCSYEACENQWKPQNQKGKLSECTYPYQKLVSPNWPRYWKLPWLISLENVFIHHQCTCTVIQISNSAHYKFQNIDWRMTSNCMQMIKIKDSGIPINSIWIHFSQIDTKQKKFKKCGTTI